MFTKSTTWNCFYSSPTPKSSSPTSANNHHFCLAEWWKISCKSPLYFRISSHLLPLPPSSDKGPPFTFSSPRSILLMTSHHSLSIFSRNFMNFCFSLVFISQSFLLLTLSLLLSKNMWGEGDCWLLWARKGEECFPLERAPPDCTLHRKPLHTQPGQDCLINKVEKVSEGKKHHQGKELLGFR